VGTATTISLEWLIVSGADSAAKSKKVKVGFFYSGNAATSRAVQS